MFNIMKNHCKFLFFLLLYMLRETINVTFYFVSSSFPNACNKSLSGTSPCSNCFATFDVSFVKCPKRDLLALLIIHGYFVTEFSGLEGSLLDVTGTSTIGSKIIFLFSRCNFCNILLSTLESNNFFSLISSLCSFIISFCLCNNSMFSLLMLARVFSIVMYSCNPTKIILH